MRLNGQLRCTVRRSRTPSPDSRRHPRGCRFAGVVAVDAGAAGAHAASATGADHRHAGAEARALAVVREAAGVLQALDDQVPADVRPDGFPLDHRALQHRVAAALHADPVAPTILRQVGAAQGSVAARVIGAVE